MVPGPGWLLFCMNQPVGTNEVTSSKGCVNGVQTGVGVGVVGKALGVGGGDTVTDGPGVGGGMKIGLQPG